MGGSTNPPMLYQSLDLYRPPIPFQHHLIDTKHDKSCLGFFNLLSKVNINLSLLDVIKDIPSYNKFFKTSISKKRRYEKDEKVVSKLASVMLQQILAPKVKDPRSFNTDITW